MSSFFINRPVFAWVIAILISLCGLITMFNLGTESYPDIVPPQIQVTATYNGASADAAEKTVAQVIEQNMTGIDHLLYFSTAISSNGRVQVTLTFDVGTNPDIAQVQVQNKISLAQPLLPQEVINTGIKVEKASAGFLMFVAISSDNPSIDRNHLNDILASNVVEQVARLQGVGSYQQYGSEYSMHIWLDPVKLQGYGLSAVDVAQALAAQNQQFVGGAIGGDPATSHQEFQAVVNSEGRLSTPEQFENIILRSNSNGTTVKLKDVARVAFGPYQYGFDTTYNNKPTAGFGIQLLSGANALNVAKEVEAKMNDLQKTFPPKVHWFIPYDTTTFIKFSIEDVVHTLFEAIFLVVLVMLLFLQNIRATIIPTLVIPVALLGTFIGMAALGFTLNQLTLFGMVLAIGIVVDDAIVVIENVERIMHEEKLTPKAATRKAMGEISGAVVAITVVLSAVFIPSGMQGGASGLIYKQFAFTIAISMMFSAFLALSFTPALCATMLKPSHSEPNAFFRAFNRGFDKLIEFYQNRVSRAADRLPLWLLLYVGLVVLCGFLFARIPSSFLPEEDQGYAIVIETLPPGSSLQRTRDVQSKIYQVLKKDPIFEGIFSISGFSFTGIGENLGISFVRFKPYQDRSDTVFDFIKRANPLLYKEIKEAETFVVDLPTVQGLSQFGGIDMYLEDRTGAGHTALMKAVQQLLAAAHKDSKLSQIRPNSAPAAPQLNLQVDRVQAQSMGLSVGDVYNALQLILAPSYINQFYYQGRVKRVMVEADAPYRMGTDAFNYMYVPSNPSGITDDQPTAAGLARTTPATTHNGPMVPLSQVIHSKWIFDSPSLIRFNGYEGMEIVGGSAPGHSTGEAMDEMNRLVSELPPGFGRDWTGQSYQEILAGNSASMLMLLSVLIVFLCLAALYESWSIPAAVLLILPLGILGTAISTLLRGLENDLYFKIGIVTVMGLSAKNAILIVEFAVALQREGKTLREAAVQAARLRLRPIIMTSLAFILGVFPMVISTGAGANARHALGSGVVGGMLVSTLFGLMLIPVFFVTMRRLLGDKLDEVSEAMLPRDDEGNILRPEGVSEPKREQGGEASPPSFDSDPERGR